MAQGGYNSGDDFPYADDVSARDEVHHEKTRDDMVGFNIEEAWETLQFKVFIKDRVCVYDATKEVDICKLQFILKSDLAQGDFWARQAEKFEFQVSSQGMVLIRGAVVKDGRLEEFWQNFIQSIKFALDGKDADSFEFKNRTELRDALQKLDINTKLLIKNGIVGLFISCEDDACIAKLVGAQRDLNRIIHGFQSAVSTGRQRGITHRPCINQHGKDPESFKRKELEQSISITADQDFYFHVIKVDKNLQEKFPNVRIIREGIENRTYKFISTDQNELTNAFSWFNSCKNEMEIKELKFSEGEHKFISQSENVQIYLQVKLRKLPAELRVTSERIYVLCHRSLVETSKRNVYESIKSVETEGRWSPEAERIRENSRGKIQFFRGDLPGKKIVRYTVDREDTALELVKVLQKYRYKEERQYAQQQVECMNVLGVIEMIQMKFEDILIRQKDGAVTLQSSEEGRLTACLKELDDYVQNTELVQLNFLTEPAQKLLQNGKVQVYVKERLKEKIEFLGNGTSFVFLKENENSKSSIFIDIKNCFVEMKIDTQCLENEEGKQFLSKHSEEVEKVDQGNKVYTGLCFTANLNKEVESLLYFYSKDCSYIIRDFLQMFGDKCLKEIGENNKVDIKLKNGRICAEGPYSSGKMAVSEAECHVDTTVLHFRELERQRTALSEKDKSQIASVARSCKCCWNAVVFQLEPPQKKDIGIEYLCTWNVPQRKEEISVAEIDYSTTKLDGLIIPVNECLFGEDIIGTGDRFYAEPNKKIAKKIGYWESFKLSGKYAFINIFVLVTTESYIKENKQCRKYIETSDLKKSCTDIIHKMFKGQYKIGFAVPGKDHNLTGKLEAVISGFQEITQFYDNMAHSKLLFGVKTEVERWIQEVDNTLKYTTNTKRHISPGYNGLINRPNTSVEVKKSSILETRADCIVVAVSQDLDLSKGFVSKLLSDACGEQLQKELYTKNKNYKYLNDWEFVTCQSFKLSGKGIQRIILGVIPPWNYCQHIEDLEKFVEDCLLLADSEGCSTVAFPALGTGNLGYPFRDVAVALFNGVDKYVSEGTIGHISTVYFSVPEKDESMFQFLEKEQKRRKSLERVIGIMHPAYDQNYIVAENGQVHYSIISKSLCEKMTTAKFVNVKFKPGNCKPEIHVDDLLNPWEYTVKCQQTKEKIKEGVRDVILSFEKERITGVNIFCGRDFKKISETDQIDVISQSVEEAVKWWLDQTKNPPIYQYLKNVRIVVSDAEFSTLCDQKINEEDTLIRKLTKSFYNKVANTEHHLKWRTVTYHLPVSQQCLNVILAGCKDSDIERAKDEITQYITRLEDDDIEDKVSAEINPGIVKYLASLAEDEFEKWKKEFRSAFEVHLLIDRNVSKIEISGTFNSILHTEEYFEKDFPHSPQNSQIGLKFDDQHYKSHVANENNNQIRTADSEVPVLQKSNENTDRTLMKPIEKQNKMNVSITFEKLSYKFKNLDVTVQCCDITDLPINVDGIVSPVNEIIDTSLGVAKDIASKAGRKYQGECKGLVDKIKLLAITKCEVTGSGNLSKCKHVMHVHSPMKVRQNRDLEDLSQVRKSVENCLIKADDLYWTSLAIPFLSTDKAVLGKSSCMILVMTFSRKVKNNLVNSPEIYKTYSSEKGGVAGFKVDLCAQEYFRALDSFKKKKSLQKVLLVDINKKKVTDVCCMLSVCCKDKYIDNIYAELSLIAPNLQSVKCYIKDHEIFSVVSDIVVMRVDENFKGYEKELCGLLSSSDDSFQTKFEEQRKVSHFPTSVTLLQSSGPSKHVLFAVTPKWKNGTDDYERNVHVTMQHILDKAEDLKASSLAFPVLCLDDNPKATASCCNAMVKSILQFLSDKRRAVRTIHLFANRKNITEFVNAFVDQMQNALVDKMQDEKETMV